MHHHSEPLPSSKGDDVRRPWWRRLASRLGARAAGPTSGERSSRSVGADGRVDHVIDPEGTVLLVRVSGNATLRTIDEVARRTAPLDRRHTVHLDLHDAIIESVQVVHALERVADRLERQRVRIRMVGLDPHHPALDARH